MISSKEPSIKDKKIKDNHDNKSISQASEEEVDKYINVKNRFRSQVERKLEGKLQNIPSNVSQNTTLNHEYQNSSSFHQQQAYNPDNYTTDEDYVQQYVVRERVYPEKLNTGTKQEKVKKKKKYQSEIEIKRAKPLQIQQQQPQAVVYQQQQVNVGEIEKLRNDIVAMGRMLKERPVEKEVQVQNNDKQDINITVEKKHEKCLKKLIKINHKLKQENIDLKAFKEKSLWEFNIVQKENQEFQGQIQQYEFDLKRLQEEIQELKLKNEKYKIENQRLLGQYETLYQTQQEISLEQHQTQPRPQEEQIREKIVEVPVEVVKTVFLDKIVEKPVEVIKHVEVPIYIEKESQKPIEQQQPQQIIQQQPQQKEVQIIEKPVEKIVEVIKEVPVDRVIEKIVEVPKIEVKEVIKEVFIELPPKHHNHYYEVPPQVIENPQDLVLVDQYQRLQQDYQKLSIAHNDLIEDFKEWRLGQEGNQGKFEKLQKAHKELSEECRVLTAKLMKRQGDISMSFEQQRQNLLLQIDESRQDQNELKLKNDQLYDEMQKQVDLNNHKNQELVRHIGFLEKQLFNSNQLIKQFQSQHQDKDSQLYKEQQYGAQIQMQLQQEMNEKEKKYALQQLEIERLNDKIFYLEKIQKTQERRPSPSPIVHNQSASHHFMSSEQAFQPQPQPVPQIQPQQIIQQQPVFQQQPIQQQQQVFSPQKTGILVQPAQMQVTQRVLSRSQSPKRIVNIITEQPQYQQQQVQVIDRRNFSPVVSVSPQKVVQVPVQQQLQQQQWWQQQQSQSINISQVQQQQSSQEHQFTLGNLSQRGNLHQQQKNEPVLTNQKVIGKSSAVMVSQKRTSNSPIRVDKFPATYEPGVVSIVQASSHLVNASQGQGQRIAAGGQGSMLYSSISSQQQSQFQTTVPGSSVIGQGCMAYRAVSPQQQQVVIDNSSFQWPQLNTQEKVTELEEEQEESKDQF